MNIKILALKYYLICLHSLLHMGLPLLCLVTVCNLFMRMVLAMLKNM